MAGSSALRRSIAAAFGARIGASPGFGTERRFSEVSPLPDIGVTLGQRASPRRSRWSRGIAAILSSVNSSQHSLGGERELEVAEASALAETRTVLADRDTSGDDEVDGF